MINKFQIKNRIKYYRDLIKVTQKELVFKDISLSHIKLLENKKRNLTTKTAKIIANNINTIAKEKGLNLSVTPENLLIPEKDLAYYLCKKRN